MSRQTGLAETIDIADRRARCDECAKKLLAEKAILAQILKHCAKEFASYDIEYIRDYCIEGNAEISSEAVHQDVKKLDKEAQNCQAEGRVFGEECLHSSTGREIPFLLDTADKSINEGTVYYDIRFSACAPGETEPIQLIINLEIQQNTSPGYPLVKRGLYYCSRLISSQRGTVFKGDDYEKLRKVYSIWICPKPPKKKANKIRRYRTIEEFLGEESFRLPDGKEIPLPSEAYDLMEVVILNLEADGNPADGESNGSDSVLRLLSVLFSNKISPKDKKQILQNEYHIAMEEKFEEEVNNMCNLSEWFWNDGHESGFTEGRADAYLHAIKRMQESLMLSAEQAMEILGIPSEERNVYLNI